MRNKRGQYPYISTQGFDMALFGRSPVNGPSQYLNDKFQEWWYVLNSIGLFSFTLLIGSL